MTTPDHTLRPVIDELRAAQTPPGDHIHFPEVEWPEPGPDGGLVGVERGCATVAAPQPDDYDLVIEAAARTLVAMAPRRPTLLQRLLPTAATAFWIAVSVWLGFLLARAEGWL